MSLAVLLILSASLLLTHDAAAHPALNLTLVNNCPFTIWPAIQPNAGHPILQNGGFALSNLTHRSFLAPSQTWSGRIWARTGCTYQNNNFHCATGDCGNRLECNGLGGATPATLAQFNFHGHNDQSSYGVSLVDGFNIPLTVTPHEGKGVCPVVGCRANLLPMCPDELKHTFGGELVGCKSGCEAFKTDELCCRNSYNNAESCKSSSYSEYFKNACPSTSTYAHDSPMLMRDCASPRELKVIFCH